MKNFFWPEIDDLWSAKKACIQSCSILLLSGIVTGVLAFLQFRGISVAGWSSSASFIDSALFFVLAFFIYRCSRVASVAGLIVYVVGQALAFREKNYPPAAILFSVLLVSGVRGAFAFHEIKKGLSAEEIKASLKSQQEEADPKPSLPKRITGWVILIAFAAGGFWLYKQSAQHKDSQVEIQETVEENQKSPTPSAISKEIPAVLQNTGASSSPSPAAALPSGERTFKLKDGRTLTGRVIADDPVYYTVKTSRGQEEIVIKEDIR